MSNLDLSGFLKSGNLKKISLLENRLKSENSKLASQRGTVPEFGGYPGIQSFFHDFILIGSESTFHSNLLDILFESIRLILNQLDSYRENFVSGSEGLDNPENPENDSNNLILLEARILTVVAKFAGFLYFLPYKSSNAARTIQGKIVDNYFRFNDFE